ncbi:diguanylate cyclase (GGDEF) domain-containing protein [Cupriavidus sp. YR651]|uniref:sensor domain-containing diguanylate cyclase n=1 Tax=Cupriavidus sp. YR651 TaxID=1855315 RepID=UPI0008905578|nr:sensor domain-containing diguanylate cyclase [Cupriavidus sp. YR651]SDD76673.1 diguanylate cyclase (GGDEF) domain-containing protein [Cupriavidus sp. YR651]
MSSTKSPLQIDRKPPIAEAAARAHTESPVLEWLLHDDQVMRECFRHATAILKSVTGASVSAVLLLDAEHQHYRAEVGLSVFPIPRKRSLCNYAIQSDEVFVVEDASTDARFADCTLVHAAPFVRSYAAIPLRGPDGEIVGALCAMDPAPARLLNAPIDVFRHLRAMIENDLRLRTATATDPLTQLFNRRHMLESVRRTWDGAADGEAMGAVMVDIDWFKQYNDTYGHPAGDACLRQVASVLQAIADEHRMIAGRLGGEEFGLLLCGLPRLAFEAALEKLRASVMKLAIDHCRSPTGVVTVSVGATVTHRAGSTDLARQTTFAAADRALYKAKEGGRNRVVIL